VLIRTLVLVNLTEDVYSNIGSIHGENTHSVLIKYEGDVYWRFFSRRNETERWFLHVLMLCMTAFRLFNMDFFPHLSSSIP
jgi:hypothetical protein